MAAALKNKQNKATSVLLVISALTAAAKQPKSQSPRIPRNGAIPNDPDSMPDEIEYDEPKQRLRIGKGPGGGEALKGEHPFILSNEE